ncbi:hypothetical protein Bca52824_011065 [Brassica carinata]|uniref:Uncharacterized protein n=1 Tax=Brassica carinata TaxID=52824 RepID=A0A8X7WFK4_BRACI|nr:hypothetical protein Bca52824_011065 [Brassica carinata]
MDVANGNNKYQQEGTYAIGFESNNEIRDISNSPPQKKTAGRVKGIEGDTAYIPFTESGGFVMFVMLLQLLIETIEVEARDEALGHGFAESE